MEKNHWGPIFKERTLVDHTTLKIHIFSKNMYHYISIRVKIWANWEIILFQKAKNLQIIKLINEKVIFYLNWSTLKKNILKYSKLHWTHIYQQLKSPPRSSKFFKRNPHLPSAHPNLRQVHGKNACLAGWVIQPT